MGTNYYLLDHGHDDDPEFHIGKSSAAGMWCFDCNVTLCKEGIEGVHKGCNCPDKHDLHERIACDRHWYKACPQCGKPAVDDWQKKPDYPIRACCSFSWAMDPMKFMMKMFKAKNSFRVIEDEYGRKCTAKNFLIQLNGYKIVFYHSVGVRFC